jgi:hypothetical protein
MINLIERLTPEWEHLNKALEQHSADLRVSSPGIIQSFNPTTQTATVQLAIRERVNLDGVGTWEDIPVLVDVPVHMPRAGGYSITYPVAAGDECLVIFGDQCMDAWWQSGGQQNQVERRRHDLSDGYALVGIWSQPRVLPGYSDQSVQLRTDDGTSYVEVKGTDVNIVADNISITARQSITITAGTTITETAGGAIGISGASVGINGSPVAINGITQVGN